MVKCTTPLGGHRYLIPAPGPRDPTNGFSVFPKGFKGGNGYCLPNPVAGNQAFDHHGL